MKINYQNRKIMFKNNIPVDLGMLSLYLIPLSLYFIIYQNHLIKYVSYMFICISLIGIYESYLFYKKYNKQSYTLTLFLCIISLIIHLIPLYVLTKPDKYMKPDIYKYIIGFLSLFVVILLPYWPYITTRKYMLYQIIAIHIVLTLIYLKF